LCEILLTKKKELFKKYNYEFEIVSMSDVKYGTVHNKKGLNIKGYWKM